MRTEASSSRAANDEKAQSERDPESPSTGSVKPTAKCRASLGCDCGHAAQSAFVCASSRSHAARAVGCDGRRVWRPLISCLYVCVPAKMPSVLMSGCAHSSSGPRTAASNPAAMLVGAAAATAPCPTHRAVPTGAVACALLLAPCSAVGPQMYPAAAEAATTAGEPRDANLALAQQPRAEADARPAAGRQRRRARLEQRRPIAALAALRLHLARRGRHIELDALGDAPTAQHRRRGREVGDAAVDARDDIGLVDGDAARLHLGDAHHRLDVVGPRH
eukprot:2895742-Prymnesium_polylepis.1